MEERFQSRFEQRFLAFFTLSKAERDERRASWMAQNHKEIDALSTVWRAALRRAKTMLALHELLESQREMLQLAEQRHAALLPFCSPNEREQEIAFASFFPLVQANSGADTSELVTLRGMSPSPINIVLLANGHDARWRDERAQWVCEIMVGWALSAGTWPYKGHVRLEKWNTELWAVFVRDDFSWIAVPQAQSGDEAEQQKLFGKIARVMYGWQRDQALRASSFYRKPLVETETAPVSQRERDKQERIEREKRIEVAMAEQSPDVLLEEFGEREALQKTLSAHQKVHQFTEREQMILLLKTAEPKLKVRQIADILSTSERAVTSDFRLIRYHINRPEGVAKQQRRKTAKPRAA